MSQPGCCGERADYTPASNAACLAARPPLDEAGTLDCGVLRLPEAADPEHPWPGMWRRCFFRLERFGLYNAIRLTRIRGASERVARGFAVGLVVNFIPTFGFGVLVSGFLARVAGGNFIAGLVGGAALTFAWPLLFLLNIWTGGVFSSPPIRVDELADVTEKTVNALVWGRTFAIGALLNSAVIGGVIYLLLRLLYERTRPIALAYFRHHAREHQRRIRRHRVRSRA